MTSSYHSYILCDSVPDDNSHSSVLRVDIPQSYALMDIQPNGCSVCGGQIRGVTYR